MIGTIILLSFAVYLLLIVFINKNRFISFNSIVSVTLFWLVFVMGFSITWLYTPINNHQHIFHEQDEILGYSAFVKLEPVLKPSSERILLEIDEIKTINGWKKGIGKVYLYIKSDSSKSLIKYGQKLLVAGSPSKIESPKNPNEFNYSEYIGFKGIYFSHFIRFNEYSIVSNGHGSKIIEYSIIARNWCEKIIEQHISTKRERAIALALIIGVKDEISKGVSSAYSSAGAMHVLAVSGLHVGVIYWIIILLLKPLKNNRFGKWIFLVTVLMGLWGYAFITGLSASVLRAVTMFSFVSMASVTNRQSNIYNTLAISAFVLLCFNPYLIMAVGFQLSFLAVFGIVYLQSKIYNLWYVKNKIIDKVWVITSVSIAAQIATAPLVALYFHQLPSYFFISNLFVIPGAFIILCSGLLLFAVDWVPMIGEWIGWMLQKEIWIINELVFLIKEIPNNTFDNIYLTTFQSWCIMIAIMAFLGLIHFRKLSWVVIFAIPVVGFSITNYLNKIDNINNTELVFYSANNSVAIDFIQGNEAYLFADSTLLTDTDKLKFHIAPYRLSRNIPIDYLHVNEGSRKPFHKKMVGYDLISWNGKLMAIISPDFDSNFKEKLTVDYVYTSKVHKKIYERIVKNFEYKLLVLKPYKELPDYVNNTERVYNLTEKGALQIKI
ncbi:MAG: ComEC family competence protein [Cyclobacteriaceae bacterium]|nr:ComEC family competence protein [Cyclobacteriaceae bacterium]